VLILDLVSHGSPHLQDVIQARISWIVADVDQATVADLVDNCIHRQLSRAECHRTAITQVVSPATGRTDEAAQFVSPFSIGWSGSF
jgi:hypothetical protein